MATGYIVWDSKNHFVVAGPFLTTADADAFKARTARNVDSRSDDKSSKNQSAQYTRESVTLA